MWLIPKTPTTTIISLAVIFALLFHPTWNFWWIENKLWRRCCALVIFGLCLSGFGYYVWPSSAKEIKQSQRDSINITAFDSKNRIVLYNPGDRKVFVSHLSLRSKEHGYSGVIGIEKTIEGKSSLVHDLKIPTVDLSKWQTGSISEDSWKELLLKRHLNENECIQWHFFIPDDPFYKTIKTHHGSSFHEVPIDATLYFRSEQDGQQITRDLKVFAVPFLYQACVTPNGTFTF